MRYTLAIVVTLLICVGISVILYQVVVVPNMVSTPTAQKSTDTIPSPTVSASEQLILVPGSSPGSPGFETKPIGNVPPSQEPKHASSPSPVSTPTPETTATPSGSISKPEGATLFTKQTVNIRQAPNTGGKVLLLAPMNTQLVYLGKEEVNNGHVWKKVKLPYGSEGWIASEFVGDTKIAEKHIFKPATVKGENINVRALPTIQSQVVQKLTPQTLLEVADGNVKQDNYTWVYVKLSDGKTGWVVSSFIQ